ncbi:hypothetical protein Tco_1022392 [Tanacetum coccineum]
MNQNFYNSNSSGFDQLQPPQYPVIHNPPQETNVEILQAKEDLMKLIQTFLKKFNRISFGETPKVLLLAWEKFFAIQHAKPEDIQELIHKLLKDLQIISEEISEFINCPSWNRPTFYNDDDEEYTIQYREYLENSSKAIAPDLPTKEPEYSLTDFDLEEEIRLVKNLSYDNSSPRLPEELNAEIADTILESLSPSPILVEDSDSHVKEIDLFLASNDLMPPGIENDNYDLERDIYFHEELLSNDSLPLPENESSNFDHHDDPSSPRPPPKPPDFEVFFDFKPDTGVLTTKVVKGISEHYVLMPNILPTLPTLDSDLDFTPSHDSLGSGNKIFDPGIFIEDCPDFEDSRARCFVHRSVKPTCTDIKEMDKRKDKTDTNEHEIRKEKARKARAGNALLDF